MNRRGVLRVVVIGGVVIATFALCWFPFGYYGGTQGVVNVLVRLFPVGRGVFEDKVANLWCSISPIIKFKQLFAQETMALIW